MRVPGRTQRADTGRRREGIPRRLPAHTTLRNAMPAFYQNANRRPRGQTERLSVSQGETPVPQQRICHRLRWYLRPIDDRRRFRRTTSACHHSPWG
jgi:hypothetical protein